MNTELVKKYGRGEFYEWRAGDTIFVTLFKDRAAAKAFKAEYAGRAWIERNKDGWLLCLKMR